MKGGEARSKEHVVSVEVSVRGEHSALGSAPHPGRAVPLAGTAWEKISPAWEQRTGRKQAEARPWPRRKSRGKGSQGGGWGRRAGSMEKFLWAEEFSSRQAQGEQLARGKHREE